MAGLLDGMFGGGGSGGNQNNLGLLALLAGSGIMAANQPGASAGQAIGQGLLSGIGSYGQMQQMQQQGQLQQQLMGLRMSEAKRKEEEAKRQAEAQQAWQRFVTGGTPATAGAGTMGMIAPAGTAESLGGPTAALRQTMSDASPVGQAAPAANIPPQIRQLAAMMGPEKGAALLAQFMKPQDLPTGFTMGPDGQPQVIPAYRDFVLDKQRAGAPQVNVGPTGIDYGDPGEGLVWQRDRQNNIVLDDRGAPIAIPFQGGPAFIKQNEVAEKAAERRVGEERQADVVLTDIDRALKVVDTSKLPTTGFFGPMVAQFGGTGASDLKSLLDTIKANVGFDKLQQMRAASPTGGALGSVTENELKLLQSVLGSLEQSQTEEQFKYNMRRLNNTYLDIIHGKGSGPERMKLEEGGGDGWQDMGNGVRIRVKK